MTGCAQNVRASGKWGPASEHLAGQKVLADASVLAGAARTNKVVQHACRMEAADTAARVHQAAEPNYPPHCAPADLG